MKDWFDALPIEVALAFMWVVGIVRTSIVYALGALAAEGGARLDRIRKAMDSPLYRKARRLINRWGVIAVPLCFLTVGLQTAVIITTGFTKMPLRRWVPAMLVGTFMWACIYTTIGFAILAALGLEPWMFPLALAIVITVMVIVAQLRERRINHETVENAPESITEN
ncbi:hypothetical protein HMPREF2527_05080 [Rothia sp. HMSC071B01]|uniref:DedA family protein n=1 Tax=Rothia sp. HMSC071B01 TaxID=1715007 RepID=UPI0008A13711|nr:VTT domain-containing protein [Rothia sp. HMSC071B01]OFN73545.1 hypothetical protein HMPREF2527_05080 [Rothia sp. HMSC071B01]